MDRDRDRDRGRDRDRDDSRLGLGAVAGDDIGSLARWATKNAAKQALGDAEESHYDARRAPPRRPPPASVGRPTNMKLVRLAVTHVCLAGGHLREELRQVTSILQDAPCSHFIILVAKTRALTFRGLYGVDDVRLRSTIRVCIMLGLTVSGIVCGSHVAL